ncbi:CHAT domain-containing protein [Calothrix sp. 336/3]|uniref:CHAT domain-containing protein n=1 Tax=Calothrix sp. 336/3 TaxID=1337936 RepID=UPI0004E411F2|nr:CHAT domain-containing protein [Calothrix sp. 336/3]AKG22948.1 hypothetical protein IJ00_18180 [Calothrix sp. 336/3]
MPSLNLAIARLENTGTHSFAIWVVNAPYPSGYVLRDCVWSNELSQVWQDWRQFFAPNMDIAPGITLAPSDPTPMLEVPSPSFGQVSRGSRLMQLLGINLWRWVFDGNILNSVERSQGMAMGQHTRLHLRLEIRDPSLTALPWEIMQREAGQPAISLGQNFLFSRTTCEVEPLPYLRADPALNILLVLGEDNKLQLDQEAKILEQTLANGNSLGNFVPGYAPCLVHTLVQPTTQELIQALETKAYNVLFYAGHGEPGPDGGFLRLSPQTKLNGMELAHVLTQNGVKLAVFNACWLAQPATVNGQVIPSSSLAEVLIRHGVPAVLGMRDEIGDEESLTFIHSFAQSLRSRKTIDAAVAEARQQLLTVYRFNQPAWTLPVLYLHPQFEGELIRSYDEGVTELPPDTTIPNVASLLPVARLKSPEVTYTLQIGVTRIGRTVDNDIVIPEPSVSKHHAEILCRNTFTGATPVRNYYLNEMSTYGTTWILGTNGWQQIHRQEVFLEPGMQIKFGSSRSQPWEFVLEEA